jgi:hypothetical protein
MYNKIFGSTKRPPVDAIFSPSVVAYMRSFLAPDIEVW